MAKNHSMKITNSKQKKAKHSQKGRKKKLEKTQSDLDTAEDSDVSIRDTPEKTGTLKDHYFLSLFICFTGVITCYSGYAVLQESL